MPRSVAEDFARHFIATGLAEVDGDRLRPTRQGRELAHGTTSVAVPGHRGAGVNGSPRAREDAQRVLDRWARSLLPGDEREPVGGDPAGGDRDALQGGGDQVAEDLGRGGVEVGGGDGDDGGGAAA